uniref:Uncharacterized protein n=1 Tax=Anguilla anguilla TaxID=7936 RepID=A0A0E9R1D6_ANGAN
MYVCTLSGDGKYCIFSTTSCNELLGPFSVYYENHFASMRKAIKSFAFTLTHVNKLSTPSHSLNNSKET